MSVWIKETFGQSPHGQFPYVSVCFNSVAATQYLKSLQKNGTWPDINYDDKSRAEWQTGEVLRAPCRGILGKGQSIESSAGGVNVTNTHPFQLSI